MKTRSAKMIDRDLLRKAGWSEELIEAAVKVASQVDGEVKPSGNTEIALTNVEIIEDSATIDFSAESTPVSSWPRF
jgi:hypothetical protein